MFSLGQISNIPCVMLLNFVLKKTFEVCATQLDMGMNYIIIICIYS